MKQKQQWLPVRATGAALTLLVLGLGAVPRVEAVPLKKAPPRAAPARTQNVIWTENKSLRKQPVVQVYRLAPVKRSAPVKLPVFGRRIGVLFAD